MSDYCEHPKCGAVVAIGRYPNGWVRLDIAGSGQEHRRYCSVEHLARAMGVAGAVLVPLPSLFGSPPSMPEIALAVRLICDRSRRSITLLSLTPDRLEIAYGEAVERAPVEEHAVLRQCYDAAMPYARTPFVREATTPEYEAAFEESEPEQEEVA